MADCLRLFDSVNSQKTIHVVVVNYEHNDSTNTKKISTITEIDLTNSSVLLFGSLTRFNLVKLPNSKICATKKKTNTR